MEKLRRLASSLARILTQIGCSSGSSTLCSVHTSGAQEFPRLMNLSKILYSLFTGFSELVHHPPSVGKLQGS